MKFGYCPVDTAAGALLAHSLKAGDLRLQKGCELTASDIAALKLAGVREVSVARPDAGDIGEDQAALRVAQAIAQEGLRCAAPVHGRVNLIAELDGVLRVDAPGVIALNQVDEAVTLATLPDYAHVREGTLTATAKMIPYFIPEDVVATAEKASGLMSVKPFRALRWGLVLTRVQGMKDSLLSKAEEATRQRVERLNGQLEQVKICDHREADLMRALREMQADHAPDVFLILTGSATSDRADVAPAGLTQAGGQVTRFGMPVDPGNLLFLGDFKGKPVIGLPGCARALALNGADWVMERVAAGIELTDADFAAMGPGGLLKDTPERGAPRRVRKT
ncbi:molybdopterin-binding protein [Thalassobius sp. I31.1]|uniref:molybdopterin-binding protein n=1 Tax=Thalassobius sp. I31.1 TaxID=2109912 RepID=UPI000D1AFDC3|nr:molybdopterin-binding protein [Thalassobius sp. I31.1]